MNTAWRTSERARRAFPRLAVAAVVLAAAVAYHGVGSNGFVLDDFHTVVMNRSLDSLTRVGHWFLSPNAASGQSEIRGYRPVLMASYAVDRAVWGDRTAGYHLTNLFIHGGVIVLVFVLAGRLWRAAAIWYERALERDPKHLLSRFNVALAAERMGKPRMAVEHYRVFLGDTPTTVVYETLRARAREAMTRLGDNG